MRVSSMERDGVSRFSNGQYGSLQVSNGGGGGGGSTVSSPLEGSPDVAYKSTWIQPYNGGYSADEIKVRRPQVRYRDCQKNHAASMGGHAVDGCGEFLPGGKEGTIEALICAACSCHRNFHRREFLGPNGEVTCSCGSTMKVPPIAGPYIVSQPLRPLSPGVRETKGYQLPSSADISPHAQMIMPLAQFDDDEDDNDDEPPHHPHPSTSSKKKRFRTKFTAEQKEKMMEFAESLGWRMSKHDDEAVQDFCNDVGVQRNVFKVWMHNNKHISAKKQGGGSETGRNCDSPSDY